ncbi:MAG: RNA polymerase sigma factor, partial [Clostridia bacterium]|nr:RNA polymerase sigma factor [Clostridia bacterium]
MIDGDLDACIARIALSDKEALKELYDGYRHIVFLFAQSVLQDAGRAEDTVQEVFIRLWANARSYRAGTNPMAWIFTITRNEAVGCLRKSRRELACDFEVDDSPEPREAAETPDESVQSRLGVEEALSLLNGHERQIVVLHVLGGLSYRVIGRLLNMP